MNTTSASAPAFTNSTNTKGIYFETAPSRIVITTHNNQGRMTIKFGASRFLSEFRKGLLEKMGTAKGEEFESLFGTASINFWRTHDVPEDIDPSYIFPYQYLGEFCAQKGILPHEMTIGDACEFFKGVLPKLPSETCITEIEGLKKQYEALTPEKLDPNA